MSKINIKIEKFRAINKLDIIIDGITVVAGENGSGKSTVSKLLYYLYKLTNNFDNILFDKLHFDLNPFYQYISNLNILLKKEEKYSTYKYLIKEFESYIINSRTYDVENLKNQTYVILNHSFDFLKFLNSTSENSESRLVSIISDLFKLENTSLNENSLLSIKMKIDNIFTDFFKSTDNKPIELIKYKLKPIFENSLPQELEITEHQEKVFSITEKKFIAPYFIQNSIFIDSPLMLGITFRENQLWEDLYQKINKKSNKQDFKLSKLISNEIIGGEVTYEQSVNNFQDEYFFKRKDGAIFNLLECATGVKSFAIIQLLLKNGSLTDKTLLIIDEPESHLHPQWIIEYARLIVLLNKEIGVKFFIASHNPDMVSAIRYISEKEGNLKDVNFYLSEKIKDTNEYNFSFLDKDIDPIFASFNIALDRINQYGI